MVDLTALSEGVNTVWVLVTAFLIFFMQPGFAMLEAGQVRTKNTANVLMKNLLDWGIGVLVYFVAGFGIAALAGGLTSTGGYSVTEAFAYVGDSGAWVTWLFGAVFAMTAATIVSGAVAGRIKFRAYVIYSIGLTAVIYPVVQGFVWNGGLLSPDGFVGAELGVGYLDFAGATVVHMLGGVAGLVGAYMIGPRRERFDDDGNRVPIPGHSITFAVIGTFILAFGWYGFNVGTQATVLSVESGELAFAGDALGRVALNTTLGMGAGIVAAAIVTGFWKGKPDPLFTANGLVAGLVAITGACAYVEWWGAIVIGLLGGAQVPIVYFWVVNNLKIDDVCGVFAVHGTAGAIGTLLIPVFAVGGFSAVQLGMQVIGVLVIAVWTVVGTAVVFKLADLTVGLRVDETEERVGLDRGEHGIKAYPEFTDSTGIGRERGEGGTTDD
ncbi:ammonium transporter [Halobacteriales archaeon QH_10_67_22]|nr:MAG: ammonium transporter [Halobacteriales archaeon QH_10_67_22]